MRAAAAGGEEGGGPGRAPAVSHCRFSADMSCRSRLATLNEKLTALERRIEYIEARVSGGGAGGRAGGRGPGRARGRPWLRRFLFPAGHQGRDADIGLGRPRAPPTPPEHRRPAPCSGPAAATTTAAASACVANKPLCSCPACSLPACLPAWGRARRRPAPCHRLGCPEPALPSA